MHEDEQNTALTIRSVYAYLPVPRIEVLRDYLEPGAGYGPQYLRVISDEGCRDIEVPDSIIALGPQAARTICVASRECPGNVWHALMQDPESIPVVDRRPQ